VASFAREQKTSALGFSRARGAKLIATLKEDTQEDQEEKVLLFSTVAKPLKFSSELKDCFETSSTICPGFCFERGIPEGTEKSRSRTADDSWFLCRSFGRGE
jgi:hypothetical protein